MTRLSDCIVCQNIEKNHFAAAFPGEIVIGFIQKIPKDPDYLFETYATFTKSNFRYLRRCLENIAKILAGKKTVAQEECNYAEGSIHRNHTTLNVKNKFLGSSCTFELSQAEHFQNFCDAIFAVTFSIILPSHEQFDACCKVNKHFRDTFPRLTLPQTALDDANKDLKFSAPIFHYLCRNFPILEFAHAMSTLAGVK